MRIAIKAMSKEAASLKLCSASAISDKLPEIIVDISNGAYQDVRTFPSSDIPSFMEKNIKQGEKHPYVCGGSHDVKRDKFGWSVLEGYEYEYLTNALKRLDETDKASYFILHTKAPTEKRGLDTRRKDMKKSFEQLERGIEKAYKYKKEHGNWPWNIEAFL